MEIQLRTSEHGKIVVKDTKILKKTESLSFLAGVNRPVRPSHVTKLAKSLNEMGCIRPVVITTVSFINGKPTKYIIDGQNLFTALMRVGWDIPYVEIPIKDKQNLVKTIALLNASSRAWCMQDYIVAWASLKQDYVKLNRYFEIYDFEISVLASILGETGTTIANQKIKSGEFKILNEQKNVEILDHLTDALDIVPRMNRWENKYFCREFVTYVRMKGCKYNHKKTMEYLKKNKNKFDLATQEQNKIKTMLDVNVK